MRVNVYSEELTDRIQIVAKTKGDKRFTGVRFHLELPVTLATGQQVQGAFLGPDDCSAAVTFWTGGDPRDLLRSALAAVEAQMKAREEGGDEA